MPKEGQMSQIFSYNKIQTELIKETKTLKVTLPQNFTFEMLFELESLLSWCTNRIEIESIYFNAQNGIFPSYFRDEDQKDLEANKLQKFVRKLRFIIKSMHYLPQTIVMDFGISVSGFGAEFILGADIRVCAWNASLTFNHLQRGIAPMANGIGLLTKNMGHSTARAWILSCKKIMSGELLEKGFIQSTYQVETETKQLLRNIFLQSSIARIQSKRAFLELISAELDAYSDFDEKICEASLITEDYKLWDEKKKDRIQYMSAIDFSENMKSNH